jgi:uncharacterized membrane protein YhaH (DUF805 family)
MNPRDLLFTADGRQTLRDLLFTFDGRVGRGKYWLAWLAWIVVVVLKLAMFFLLGWVPYLAICLALIVGLLLLTSSVAVGIKRLHDRGKSGGWLFLFYLGPGVLGKIGDVMTGSIGVVFDLASVAIFVWMIVELGCLRGTVGANNYGPDPLVAWPEQPATT